MLLHKTPDSLLSSNVGRPKNLLIRFGLTICPGGGGGGLLVHKTPDSLLSSNVGRPKNLLIRFGLTTCPGGGGGYGYPMYPPGYGLGWQGCL